MKNIRDLIAITHEVEKEDAPTTAKDFKKMTQEQRREALELLELDMRAAAKDSIRESSRLTRRDSRIACGVSLIRGRIYEMEINKELTRTGRKDFPSQTEGFYFQVVSASKKQGLEIVALDDVNERYQLFDISTTSSSIAQALREEASELAFLWMHPEQSDIEEARQKWTKWMTENIVPYHGNPFEKTESMGFMVEDKGNGMGS